jgi:magnesium transporter
MTNIKYDKFDFYFTRVVGPDLEEELDQKYKINELDIEDISSGTQLSKLEVRRDYVYIAVQFPEFDKSTQKFLIKDLHCFVSNSWMVVIDKQNYKHFEQFLGFQQQLLEDEEVITPYLFFAEMLDFCMTKTYKAIMKFKSDISQVESDLFEFTNDIDVLKDILIIKKNLVNFESVIAPVQSVINELETKTRSKITTEETERLDNSLDTTNKIINNLNNFREQMDVLTQTNESLMNRNTSMNIKNLNLVVVSGFLAIFVIGFLNLLRFVILDGYIVYFVALVILFVASLVAGYMFWANSRKG